MSPSVKTLTDQIAKTPLDTPAVRALIDELSPAISQVAQIERSFRETDQHNRPSYKPQDIEIINTARQYYEVLYETLLDAIRQSVSSAKDTQSADTAHRTEAESAPLHGHGFYPESVHPADQLTRLFQSIYVLTAPLSTSSHAPSTGGSASSRNPDSPTVLAASDLEKQIFARPVTETAFMQSVDQLIAVWLIFAISGDSTIFAIAPLTLIANQPIISTTQVIDDTEYVRIFFRPPADHLEPFCARMKQLKRAIADNSPYLSIIKNTQLVEVRMLRKTLAQGTNYDATQGRMPLANHIITLPLDNRVVVQTGFGAFPTELTVPTVLRNLLERLNTTDAQRLNTILAEGLELISNEELYLPPHLATQAQTYFRTILRNELKNLHYEVHLWFHFFLRSLMSTHELQPHQIEKLSTLSPASQSPSQDTQPTYQQMTQLLFNDLYLLSNNEKTVMKKMEQFSELLETYDRTSMLGQRRRLDLRSIIEKAIDSFPKVLISNRYVPQTITTTLKSHLEPEKTAIGFALFPELLYHFLAMNAAQHNPLDTEIDITVTIDTVTIGSRSFARVTTSNRGTAASESVIRQLYNDQAKKVISLSSTGSGTSLKTALALTCLQTNTPIESARTVFGVDSMDDQFTVWYLLPLSTDHH